MASFSNPNLSAHGINSTKNILLTCARYDSSYHIDNVQLVHEGGDLEIFNYVVINEQQQQNQIFVDEQIIVRMHLEKNLWIKSGLEATLP